MATLSPEDSFRQHMIALEGLAAIGERWHESLIPERSRTPVGRYFRTDGSDVQTHQGAIAAGSLKLQVEIWDPSLDTAKQLEAVAVQELRTVQGRLGGAQGVRIDFREIKPLTDAFDRVAKFHGRRFTLDFDYRS